MFIGNVEEKFIIKGKIWEKYNLNTIPEQHWVLQAAFQAHSSE